MSVSILITQCLQNDFVKPIDKFEHLPNKLHIGYREAERLIGADPDEGPINKLMEWAYSHSNDDLKIIHIRDWHDKNDPKQQAHLNQFGEHCIQNTEGAQFVFKDEINDQNSHTIINASGLNDFISTNLKEVLDQYQDQDVNIGLVGVWTDAKISFLAYELVTRYASFNISICSALTASSSTAMHYISLDHLENLLGIQIYSSISDFTLSLTNSIPEFKQKNSEYGTQLSYDSNNNIDEEDTELLKYLFRVSKSVDFKVLDGGFSGNVVLKSQSTDIHGHKEVPSVVKIGPRKLIAKERDSFERIKDVLGNSAPNIIDFAENENRGAIKYRYAAMFGDEVKTFQSFYGKKYDTNKVKEYLQVIFNEQLGRLYEAKKSERIDLLSYYDFSSKYAESVQQKVEKLIGTTPSQSNINIEGHNSYNVCRFYHNEIDTLIGDFHEQHFMSYIHGDLNGANILIDGQENVWLIDFFHTHYGHILKDLIKLENDLLFIFMEIKSKVEFDEAIKLIDLILNISDLAHQVKQSSFTSPSIQRAYETINLLRSFYPDLIESVRDPYQYHVAMLRYSMHTLTFDESNDWQKKLALYMGSRCAELVLNKHKQSKVLRLDFLTDNESFVGKNQVALTILPGRKDRDRILKDDLNSIKNQGVNNLLCLVTKDELEHYGVETLLKDCESMGIETLYSPIKDQGIPSYDDINTTINWIQDKVNKNEKVVIHCVGGLGRSGTIAALYLMKQNQYQAQKAITLVRESRSPRAIESKQQIDLINNFA